MFALPCSKVLKETVTSKQDFLTMLSFNMALKVKGFERTKTKSCDQFVGKTPYETIEMAMKDCQEDDKCGGIYDDHCNRRGEFELCKQASKILNGVKLSSCIYTKDLGKSVYRKVNI